MTSFPSAPPSTNDQLSPIRSSRPLHDGHHSLYSHYMLTIASRLDVMNRLGRAMADPSRAVTRVARVLSAVSRQTYGVPGGAYGVLPDGATLPDNATAISANVYRIGGS